jgi:hypothetical protein
MRGAATSVCPEETDLKAPRLTSDGKGPMATVKEEFEILSTVVRICSSLDRNRRFGGMSPPSSESKYPNKTPA